MAPRPVLEGSPGILCIEVSLPGHKTEWRRVGVDDRSGRSSPTLPCPWQSDLVVPPSRGRSLLPHFLNLSYDLFWPMDCGRSDQCQFLTQALERLALFCTLSGPVSTPGETPGFGCWSHKWRRTQLSLPRPSRTYMHSQPTSNIEESPARASNLPALPRAGTAAPAGLGQVDSSQSLRFTTAIGLPQITHTHTHTHAILN